ncbi:unnamed protein product, partial [Ectocarpus fasciculatus]
VLVKTRAFRCKHRGEPKPEEEEDTSGKGRGRGRGNRNGKGPPPNKRKSRRVVTCNRACRFAYPNEMAVYCAIHALEGMVDVLNPQCSMDDCLEIPTYGFAGEQPTFCMVHSGPGMQAS